MVCGVVVEAMAAMARARGGGATFCNRVDGEHLCNYLG